MMITKAKIIKIISGKYFVYIDTELVLCSIKKSLKNKLKVKVGDIVSVQKQLDSYIIIDVAKRKNELLRPDVANIDQIIIVLAPKPKPDFTLIDKLIIMADNNKIPVILCINKCDLTNQNYITNVIQQYFKAVYRIFVISAKTKENIDMLSCILKDKVSVFAGQSAVGKSSIINCLNPELQLESGEMSKKIERGKNTTRHTEIYKISDNSFVIDSPGFSILELYSFDKDLIINSYKEIKEYSTNCKYADCDHINIKNEECAVKSAVKSGLINKNRYERYVDLLNRQIVIDRNRY